MRGRAGIWLTPWSPLCTLTRSVKEASSSFASCYNNRISKNQDALHMTNLLPKTMLWTRSPLISNCASISEDCNDNHPVGNIDHRRTYHVYASSRSSVQAHVREKQGIRWNQPPSDALHWLWIFSHPGWQSRCACKCSGWVLHVITQCMQAASSNRICASALGSSTILQRISRGFNSYRAGCYGREWHPKRCFGSNQPVSRVRPERIAGGGGGWRVVWLDPKHGVGFV